MDFNSNDEYLKAFPPNFGRKLESHNMLNQSPNVEVERVLLKNQQDNVEKICMKQIPKDAYLSKGLEVQQPIQVPTFKLDVKNKGNEMFEVNKFVSLPTKDLRPSRNKSSLEKPKLVEMAPAMEVQRELGESDGEPSVEIALSLQDVETRVVDASETLLRDDAQVDEPPFAEEIMRETTVHCEMIPAEEDAIAMGIIKDSDLALDNIGHNYEGEKSVVEEATEKDETSVGFISPLREFVEGFVEQERPRSTDIDTEEGNNEMDVNTEPLQGDVQNGQPPDPDQITIEFVEDTMTTNRIGTSKDANAMASIESEEPVSLEMVNTTATITATYETKASLIEQTQVAETEVMGTEDAATMALEITEKTTVKAKAVCLFEGEEEEDPYAIARNGVPSASSSTTGFEDVGSCSDADVDKIVDSIMNDIADIEADMEVEDEEVGEEADMESNTQHQKLEICGKSGGVESAAVRQDYIQSTGSHA